MIVSRFAIVTKDLVICCYQGTKIYSSRYGFAIASSAWEFQAMELQACFRVIAQSRRGQDRECILVLPRFVCTSPFAVTTTVGVLDLRRVSISSEVKYLVAQHVH